MVGFDDVKFAAALTPPLTTVRQECNDLEMCIRDSLDPAIMRPGRFDRKVVVGRPDVGGREEILGVHAKKKPSCRGCRLKADCTDYRRLHRCRP